MYSLILQVTNMLKKAQKEHFAGQNAGKLPINAPWSSPFWNCSRGGEYPDLRKHSAHLKPLRWISRVTRLAELVFGEPKDVFITMIENSVPYLPKDKPRYLMGIGSIDMILEGVARGVDMFDCVLPTRIARHGALIYLNTADSILKQAQYKKVTSVRIEEGCDAILAKTFTRAYLRHLYVSEEALVAPSLHP